MVGPYSLSNRRALAVLSRLGEIAGTGILGVGYADGPLPADFDQPERAMALVEAGESALTLFIETAGNRRKTYKAMTPDRGVAAVLLLTRGLLHLTADLAAAPGHHLSESALRDAKALLDEVFPRASEDAQTVGAISTARAGLDESDEARLDLILCALGEIVGREQAIRLPGFAGFEGDAADRYSTDLQWQIASNNSLPRLLMFADAQGMKTWRS